VQRYIVRRLISTVFTLFGISIIVFLLVRMVPGTIIDSMLGVQVARTPEVMKEMREFFGLDAPLPLQYVRWIGDIVRGDFGNSWRGGMTVWSLIVERFPVTLELTMLAMLIAVCVGVPTGVISAVYRDSWLDNLLRVFSFASLGLPNFWQGAMLILFVSLVLHWVPPLQYVSPFKDPIRNLGMFILPAIALGTVNVANVMRLTRSAMLEVLSQDYIRTARAKGLRERVVVVRHALRNGLITIVTIATLMTSYMLGGAVAVEAVFVLPGVGRLILMAMFQRDYPAVQGVLLFTCGLFVMINFLVDIMYAAINPRIRYA
jgi:peptide/nickel transport system permease protein